MSDVLLISENTLKKKGLINGNVDGMYILSAIQVVQDLYLSALIGPVLLQKVCDLVDSGAIATATDYKTLLDKYITPYMTYKVVAQIQLNVNFKTTNSGVIQNSDDKKAATDYTTGRALEQQYVRYAEAYGTKLQNYLICNASKYPEFNKSKDNETAEEQSLCGIYFPSHDR